MAVKEMIVCDVCGSPAAAPVTLSITINGKRSNFTKDLCKKDLETYMAKARPSRPGRPSGHYVGSKPTAAPESGSKKVFSTKIKKQGGLPELHPEGMLVAS